MTMMAIASLVATGYSIYSQNEQIKETNVARQASREKAVQEQNEIIRRNRARKSEAASLEKLGMPENNMAGGSTLLTSSNNKQTSLLG